MQASDFITVDEGAFEDAISDVHSQAEDLYNEIEALDQARRQKLEELRDLVEEAERTLEELNEVEGDFNIRNAEIDVDEMRDWLDEVEY